MRIKNGVKLYNSAILREYNFGMTFTFSDIRIVNCKIDTRGNNSYGFYSITNCFIDNLTSENNTTLYIGGNTNIYNSKINGYGFNNVKESNVYFNNTILGLTKNPYRTSDTGNHTFKLYFDKCVYNQFNNYIYGLIDIKDDMFVQFKNSIINSVGAKYVFRTHGIIEKLCSLELINCEINSDISNTIIFNNFSKVKHFIFENNIINENIILPDKPILEEKDAGYMFYDKTDSKLVLWNGYKWIKIGVSK